MNCGSDYSFGSVSGSVFAFYLFLAISALIGISTYALLAHPKLRRVWFREWTGTTRLASMTVAALLGLMVLLSVYFSSLAGFYRLESTGRDIRLISEVRREPAFRGRWRLDLYTPTGAQFTSANASYAEVKNAGECLELRLRPAGGRK